MLCAAALQVDTCAGSKMRLTSLSLTVSPVQIACSRRNVQCRWVSFLHTDMSCQTHYSLSNTHCQASALKCRCAFICRHKAVSVCTYIAGQACWFDCKWRRQVSSTIGSIQQCPIVSNTYVAMTASTLCFHLVFPSRPVMHANVSLRPCVHAQGTNIC